MAGTGSAGPELLMILLVMFVIWAIPLIAAIWAIVTLYRVRVDQQAMRRTLDNVESLLRSR